MPTSSDIGDRRMETATGCGLFEPLAVLAVNVLQYFAIDEIRLEMAVKNEQGLSAGLNQFEECLPSQSKRVD